MSTSEGSEHSSEFENFHCHDGCIKKISDILPNNEIRKKPGPSLAGANSITSVSSYQSDGATEDSESDDSEELSEFGYVGTNFRCQKCLEIGHMTYECRGKQKYLSHHGCTEPPNKRIKMIGETKENNEIRKKPRPSLAGANIITPVSSYQSNGATEDSENYCSSSSSGSGSDSSSSSFILLWF